MFCCVCVRQVYPKRIFNGTLNEDILQLNVYMFVLFWQKRTDKNSPPLLTSFVL